MSAPAAAGFPSRCRVAIVGGGITGLSAAHRLIETDAVDPSDVAVLEADDRLGGQIRSLRDGEFLFEAGADTMVTQKPAGLALCHRLGLEQELVFPYSGKPGVHVLRRGKLFRVPDGFMLVGPTRLGPLLRSPLFGPADKLRMILERFVPPAASPSGDESLRSFVTRRFGRAAFERVAEPIVGGLFTADSDRLSMQMTLSRFLDVERRSGSVWRGLARMRDPRSGAPHATEPVALRGGMQQLVDRLVERLSRITVATGTPVRRLARSRAGRWEVDCGNGRVLAADAVVLACPAFVAARLLRQVAPALAGGLADLDYASCATINLVYDRRSVARTPRGFGFFVPRTEGLPLLACSYVSQKFPGRAPDDRLVLRAYVGGALHGEILELDDPGLVERVDGLLRPLLGISGEPLLARVQRHPRAMPQYPVGDLERVRRIERQLQDHDDLSVCGGSLDAIGLPDCIRSGERAADRVAEHLEHVPRIPFAAVDSALSRRTAGS